MYEKSTGDTERIEYVKRKAMEYAENAQDWGSELTLNSWTSLLSQAPHRLIRI